MRSLCRGLVTALVGIQVFTTQVWAEVGVVTDTMVGPPPAFDLVYDLVRPLVLAAVFTIVGVLLFIGAIWVVVRLCPFSIQKEIEDDQNTALGLIMGSIILGIAIILAAAMIG